MAQSDLNKFSPHSHLNLHQTAMNMTVVLRVLTFYFIFIFLYPGLSFGAAPYVRRCIHNFRMICPYRRVCLRMGCLNLIISFSSGIRL